MIFNGSLKENSSHLRFNLVVLLRRCVLITGTSAFKSVGGGGGGGGGRGGQMKLTT